MESNRGRSALKQKYHLPLTPPPQMNFVLLVQTPSELFFLPSKNFFDFEVGGYDGAYKGRVHVIVLFIDRKNDTLSARQQSYHAHAVI